MNKLLFIIGLLVVFSFGFIAGFAEAKHRFSKPLFDDTVSTPFQSVTIKFKDFNK